MFQKLPLIITLFFLFKLPILGMSQDQKDHIFGKKWYAVKVFYNNAEYQYTDFICEESSLPDNKPYFFYFDINHSGDIKTDRSSKFKYPRLARIERGKLVMYSSSNSKIEFEIIYVSDDFLQIKEEDNSIYFLISDNKNQ